MSVDLGSAYLQIIPSLRGAGNTITKELGSAGTKAGGLFSSGFAKALGPLAAVAGAAIGIGAITDLIKDSVGAASDLQQSMGGVDAIFGKNAKTIHKWAKNAQTSVGLSENSYNELANVIGSQLKNAGESMDAVGKKTNSLIKTGADLAATFGGSTADAVDAISSALKGERDPIEKYGVSLNQAKIDAEAAALGFKKVGGSLSTQANQAATLALIYKQTSAASGQFSAQTNTLAEQQQIFGATLENVKAKVGTAFLPAITSVVGALSNSLDPALKLIQPKLDAFGQKAAGVGTAVAGFIKGLSLDPAAAGAVTQPLDKFVAAGQSLRSFITSSQPVVQTYLRVLQTIGPLLGQAFQQLGPGLGQALTTLAPALALIIPPLAKAAVDILPSLVKVVLALTPLIPPLAQIIVALTPAISALADGLVFLINNAVTPVIKGISGMITLLTKMAGGTFTAGDALGALSGKFGIVVQAIATFGAGVGFAIGTVISKFRSLPGQIGAILGNLGGLLVSSGRSLMDGFISGIKSSIGAVGNAVSGVLNFVKGFFPHSPAKRGPFSGAGWRQVAKSGGALASQFTAGFNEGAADFGSSIGKTVPDTFTSSMAGMISSTSQAPATTVLVNNKTNVRLEDLVDVRIARNSEEETRAQRLGYQPLVFG